MPRFSTGGAAFSVSGVRTRTAQAVGTNLYALKGKKAALPPERRSTAFVVDAALIA
jgi:hypothetical protein